MLGESTCLKLFTAGKIAKKPLEKRVFVESAFKNVTLYTQKYTPPHLSLIHISEPTRLLSISYAVFCLKKKIILKETLRAIYLLLSSRGVCLCFEVRYIECLLYLCFHLFKLALPNRQNCRKSSVVECIFVYLALNFACQFNKNSHSSSVTF